MSNSFAQEVSAAYFIKYNPLLSRYFGSQNATILFDRLEYWFSKKQSQFYKFIEPCDHPLCKKGDTWSEELGFSKKVFRTAFDKIGVRYRSKTEFEAATDPFQGKFFAYYQDRQTKKTIFVRNNDLVKDLYQNLKSMLSPNTDLKKQSQTPDTNRAGGSSSLVQKKGSPTADPLGSPHGRAYKDKQIATSYSKIRKNDSLENEGKRESVHNMIKTWKQVLGSDKKTPTITPVMINRLYDRFQNVFEGSLEKWKGHVKAIGSSKFLMGEKTGGGGEPYELRFWVATSQAFKDNLEQDVFDVGTRVNDHFEYNEASERKSLLLKDIRDSSECEEVKKARETIVQADWKVYESWFKQACFNKTEKGITITWNSTFSQEYVENNLGYLLDMVKGKKYSVEGV